MNPIHMIPWQNDFITALGDWLVQREDFQQATVIFTHRRPRQYLKRYLSEHPDLPRPCFMPTMTSVADFIGGLRSELGHAPLMQAKRLDQAELLYGIVRGLRQQGHGLLATLPQMERETFLPWGLELAKLMEELLRHNMEPADLAYMEHEVADYAAALLEQLRSIFNAYVEALHAHGWTTPGVDCCFAAEHTNDIISAHQNKPLIAAGFYALSGAEDALFRALWQHNILDVCWHTDPDLAHGGHGHWAATEHRHWLRNWQAQTRLLAEPVSRPLIKGVRFREGFDRHSQLAALKEELVSTKDANKTHENTAIVLPDAGALMPVLHHLPDEDVNISMGYPLERTSLARLVETIVTLRENRLDDGRYHWKDMVNLIRHPYIKMLGDQTSPDYRRVLFVWEASMRQGEPYVRPEDWVPAYGIKPLENIAEERCEPLRREVMRTCLENFENISTLSELADALNDLVTMLHANGPNIWKNFLIDAECLYRLASSVIPELKAPLSSNAEFSLPVLTSILRKLMQQERVSFEPDPITGLQVLGVLETRLLHFKRLFLLDAVEERLPGTNAADPLLPDPMRGLLGLPDSRERDNVAAYNFYRLVMGADQTVIFYQSGIQPGLLDGKSIRSRFVEQLLWEMEKAKGDVINTGDPEILPVNIKSGPVPHNPGDIAVTEDIRAALHDHLENKGLTPSKIDTYLHCPKRFFLGTLARLRPITEITEEADPAELGTLVHEVLREFFSGHMNRRIIPAELDATSLLALYEKRLKESELYQTLPYDGKTALAHTGRYRLERHLQAQQEPTTILGLETELTAEITVQKTVIPLRGTVDRVDQRDLDIRILDYKTGNLKKPGEKFWSDDELWQRMNDSDPADTALLPDLAKSMQSVQLPAYLHLYEHGKQADRAVNAALVDLKDTGREKTLFPDKWEREEMREIIEDQIPQLIYFLVTHIHDATVFPATPSSLCDWCDFKRICGR
ncbi:PD-(D/E)XK nuclease family protein [Pseudodesulfovibrio senegalensis]|uniref:PD-(D/E)XK nuclease family protein n=1 Tax=Pseudodesulfovibrio senegalensis TaxID=1721087 RepID=A0A6N6N2G3_9BACT|nr:PD-(D/E)XK nuclease family protein [Pseudodesulfovibrio senegalensis]KAB1440381.1 PD-(D/E)XK nuclease family protein [Pseudodesulfovibrio senegalensis]